MRRSADALQRATRAQADTPERRPCRLPAACRLTNRRVGLDANLFLVVVLIMLLPIMVGLIMVRLFGSTRRD
jgi:hypothetical protein